MLKVGESNSACGAIATTYTPRCQSSGQSLGLTSVAYLASYSGSCRAISCVTLLKKPPPTPPPKFRLLLAPAARRCLALRSGRPTAPPGLAGPFSAVSPAAVAVPSLLLLGVAAAAGPLASAVSASVAVVPTAAAAWVAAAGTPHTSESSSASKAGGRRSNLSKRKTSSSTLVQVLRTQSPYLHRRTTKRKTPAVSKKNNLVLWTGNQETSPL